MLYIFDWDGTLSQSLEHIVDSIEVASSEHGLPGLSLERRLSVIGLGLEEAFSDLFPEVDASQHRLLLNSYRRAYLELDMASPSPLFEGVQDTLEYLISEGHELAVATGKARKGLDRVMDAAEIGHLFRATRCVDEAKSKPDPLMLHQLLELTGYPAEQAVLIGDTDFDLKMAGNANIRAIGVSYGAHSTERLLPCRPHTLIDDIRQLQEVSF
jgi:phosphoglycolate phosphatase